MKQTLTLFIFLAMYSGCSAGNDKPVIPSLFSLTYKEIPKLLSALPESMAAEISADPAGFLFLLDRVLEQDRETYLIADKKTALPPGYEPGDLISLNKYSLAKNRNDLSLRRIIMPDVMAMNTAADNAGLKLVYSSTYRSYDYQAGLYARNVREMGREAADRESARPGTSQHQLGTTMDFGTITDEFAYTEEGIWLMHNAWKYGFSLSYPEGYEDITGYRSECWHYRWVGRAAAEMIHTYFHDVQHYFMYFINENWDLLISKRT